MSREQVFLCWLGKVHYHTYVRTYVVALMVYPLSLEFCHPGTSLLALAREEVGIEYSQIAAVFIKYLVCLDVWVVYRYLFVLLKGDAIQFVGEAKHTVYHFVQLE